PERVDPTSSLASADSPASDDDNPAPAPASAVAGEVAHKQKMLTLFPDAAASTQATPQVIPKLENAADPSGMIATYQPNGTTETATNPFFQNLGSNGRTCFTCHEPQDGWTLSAQHAQARFAADPTDPLFRLVDGATCPSADLSTPAARSRAFSLLTGKGLIRIGLPMLPTMQFQILSVQDPYNCNTSPLTGLTGVQSGTASFYRRPLPSANLGFLSTIMWDAQGNAAPSAAQQQQIVTFEGCTTANNPGPCATIPTGAGLFTAQLYDANAGYLAADGANGGPVTLAQQLAGFFIGVNDPLGFNPSGTPFSPVIFTEYDAWANLTGNGQPVAARGAIARGELVFNTVPINITGVSGSNDDFNVPSVQGFCGTCHDTPNSGNHSVKAPLN